MPRLTPILVTTILLGCAQTVRTAIQDNSSRTPTEAAPQPKIAVMALAISPDDQLVATASEDRMIRVWNLKTGYLRFKIPSGFDCDFDIGFAARAARLSASGKDRIWRIWDTGSGALVETIRLPPMREFRMAASTPGNETAVLRKGTDAVVFEKTRPVRVLHGNKGEVLSVAISADGLLAVTGGRDSTALVWQVATGEVLHSLSVDDGPVVGADVTGDASIIATASGRTIRLWDAHSGSVLRTLTGHRDEVCCVVFSHDRREAVSTGRDGSILVWSVENGALARHFSASAAIEREPSDAAQLTPEADRHAHRPR